MPMKSKILTKKPRAVVAGTGTSPKAVELAVGSVARVAFLFLLVCALNLAPVAFALEGAGDWSKQIDTNGRITLTEGTILIQGSDNAGPEYPSMNTVTGLTTVSSIGETVSFDWEYWTTDSAYYDRPQMLLNGVWLDFEAGWVQSVSGTRTVQVTSGQAFGFRILSLDSCCGAGFLRISNTTWVVGTPTPTPEPTPTPTPAPEPTPTPTPEPTAAAPSPGSTPVPTAQPDHVLFGEAATNGVTPEVSRIGSLLLLGATVAAAVVASSRFKRLKSGESEFPEATAPRKWERRR